MKQLATILIAFIGFTSLAQEKTKVTSTITNLTFSVDNPEEFKAIKWNEIKDVFQTEKDSEIISLSFELKNKNKKKANKSFTIKGEAKHINKLIKVSKKAVKKIFKSKKQ